MGQLASEFQTKLAAKQGRNLSPAHTEMDMESARRRDARLPHVRHFRGNLLSVRLYASHNWNIPEANSAVKGGRTEARSGVTLDGGESRGSRWLSADA